MKSSFWDFLSVLVILGVILESIFFLTIYINPNSSLNPFPPPTLPTVIIPAAASPTATQTGTPFNFPATWTATQPGFTATLLATSVRINSETPIPSNTSFVIPSFTPYTPSGTVYTSTAKSGTMTPKPEPTATQTNTPTPVPSDTPQSNYDQ